MDKKSPNSLKKHLATIVLSIPLIVSCVTEEYDLSNLSSELLVTETALNAPIGSVSFCLGDFFEQENAKGFITTLDSIIKVHNLQENEQLPFPIIAKNVEITSTDTLRGVYFNKVLGMYHEIDSLEAVDLKLEIENQLPINAELTLEFLKREKDKTNPDKEVMIDIPSLTRSVSVKSSITRHDTKELLTATKESSSIKFVGEECRDLEKVTDLVLYYKVNSLLDGETIYIAEDYRFKLSISAFMKAKLIFDID